MPNQGPPICLWCGQKIPKRLYRMSSRRFRQMKFCNNLHCTLYFNKYSRSEIPVTQEQQEMIKTMYLAGHGAITIARQVGVTEWVVYRELKRAGIPTRSVKSNGGKRNLAREEQIKQLRAQGLKFKDIAKQMGVSIFSAWYVCNRKT